MISLAPPIVTDNRQYNIVVVGDSIDGTNYGNWQSIISNNYPRKKIRILNLTVDGTKVLTMLSNTTTVDAAVLTNAVNILLMGGGTNDICGMVSDGRTPTDIYNDIVSYLTGRTGYQYKVWRPILPRTQVACAAVAAGTFESSRTTINTAIHAYASGNTHVCNCDTDPNIGLVNCSNNTVYYETDKVHLNPTGAAIFSTYQIDVLNDILL